MTTLKAKKFQLGEKGVTEREVSVTVDSNALKFKNEIGAEVLSTPLDTPVDLAQPHEKTLDAAKDVVKEEGDDIRFNTGNKTKMPIDGWAELNTDKNDRLITGIDSEGVSHASALKVYDKLDAPGFAEEYKDGIDDWLNVRIAWDGENYRVVGGMTQKGQIFETLDTGYTKVFDPQDIVDIKADVLDLQENGATSAEKPNHLRDLVRDLFNPLKDVTLLIVGASVEWGLTLPENSPSSPSENPRKKLLSDNRNNLSAPSYINVLHQWIATAMLDMPEGTLPTEENAPGSSTGGTAMYSDSYQFIDPRYSLYVKLYDSQGTRLEKTGDKISGASVPAPLEVPTGGYIEFDIRGDNFELIYGKTVAGGEFEIFLDGESLGTLDYTGTAVSWGESVPLSSLPNDNHIIRIQNNGTGPFKIEQIKRTKYFRMVNQGIIGSGTNEWRPSSTWHLITNAIPPACSHAIINLGSNDRAQTTINPVNVSRVKEFKREIVQYLLDRNIKCILGGSAPISLDFPNEGSSAQFSQLQIGRINKELAQEMGVSYIDRYVRSVQGRIDGSWQDGVAPGGDNHPNELGHKILAQSYIDNMIKYVDDLED